MEDVEKIRSLIEKKNRIHIVQGGKLNWKWSLIDYYYDISCKTGGEYIIWGLNWKNRKYYKEKLQEGDVVLLKANKDKGSNKEVYGIFAVGVVSKKFKELSRYWPEEFTGKDIWHYRFKIRPIAIVKGAIKELESISDSKLAKIRDMYKNRDEKIINTLDDIRLLYVDEDNSGLVQYNAGQGSIKLKTYNEVADEINKVLSQSRIIFPYDKLDEAAMKMTTLLEKKGQLILYGPPGTGKTWLALDYVRKATEENKQGNRWEVITFHQSYGYEEFIEGLKPKPISDKGGIDYEVEDGVFKRLVVRAIWEVLKCKAIPLETEGGNSSSGDMELFEKALEKFKECYKAGSLLETHNEKVFEIVEYRDKRIMIRPLDGKGNLYGVSIDNLKLLWKSKDEIKSVDDVKKIKDTGETSYYYAIYKKLKEFAQQIKVQEKYQDKENGQYEYMRKLVQEALKHQLLSREDFENAPKFYLIIDEINRGNISKIFGELITLLEKDKRIGEENEVITILPYSGDFFGVPSNLYVIGTMNTADRSIALLDVALRRRFAFLEVEPQPEKVRGKNIEGIPLEELLKMLNLKIEALKDRDHRIGHSYFRKVKSLEDLHFVWYNEILPLLQEYFYNDWDALEWILGKGFIEKDTSVLKSKKYPEDLELNPVYRIREYDLGSEDERKEFMNALRWIINSIKMSEGVQKPVTGE